MGSRPATVAELDLVFESKITTVLPGGGSPRGEASGVLARGQELLVIFDDSTEIGVVRNYRQSGQSYAATPDPARRRGWKRRDRLRGPGTRPG